MGWVMHPTHTRTTDLLLLASCSAYRAITAPNGGRLKTVHAMAAAMAGNLRQALRFPGKRKRIVRCKYLWDYRAPGLDKS